MNIALRILEIIVPVIAIILLGYVLGRLWKPDMRVVNRFNLEVFGPFLVLANLSDKSVDLASLWPLVVASIAIVIGSGLIAWPYARLSGQNPRTFVPPSGHWTRCAASAWTWRGPRSGPARSNRAMPC